MSAKPTPLLTPKVLFTQPGLRLTQPSQFKFSPCGRQISWLQGTAEAPTTLDLWCYQLSGGEASPLVKAQNLGANADESVTELSDAERAERERKRQFTFGVSAYQWIGDAGALAVYADGQAYRAQSLEDSLELVQITPTEHRHSGFNPSISGSLMSYVRQGNLYYKNLGALSQEVAITDNSDDCVSNGLPDFLAAEEMHRFSGAWWSKCERYLIFCRNDEGPVDVSHRLEIDGNGSRTVPQRYPYAGETNPSVTLHIYDIQTKTCRQIWQSEDGTNNTYLARVNPISGGVCLQTQDRLQQNLTLSSYCFADESWKTHYRETASTWINLSDDLLELDNGELLFSTEDQGPRQAIVISKQGAIRRLHGPMHINQILSADESSVLAAGWDETPIENHLFELALDGSGYRQITVGAGVHDVVVHQKQNCFVDRHSDLDTPVRICVKRTEANKTSQAEAEQVLFEEAIQRNHPYAPYASNHVTAKFGVVESAGHSLHYRLTPPANIQGCHPTIVYVYGGPGAQKVRRDWGSLLVQLFAQRGFGVLELDNRGSTNRGSAFEAPLYKNMGSIEVEDQVLATSVLADESWADPLRIGVFGHSYGGYMTLMCLAKAGDYFKAGAAVAPVADWRLYDSHYTERFMGLPKENEEAYVASSVIPHLAMLDRPLLLMHGMADDNVLFTNSTMLMSELQKLGKPFELMTYPGAKHSMQESHVSIHRFETILDFFDRTL